MLHAGAILPRQMPKKDTWGARNVLRTHCSPLVHTSAIQARA